MSNRYIIVFSFVAISGASFGYWYYGLKNTNDTTSKNSIPTEKLLQEDTTMPSKLSFKILKEATSNAAQPQKGQMVTVHYTGWLSDNGAKGKKFDSSIDRGQPFQFIVGVGQVIQGWDEAVLSMKVGEKREVLIPSELGYGSYGAGDVIPPHADLIFDIDILDAQ